MAEKEVCKLGASVPTGLEVGAAEECAEVLGRPPVHYRGRLAFTLDALEELIKVDNLRSVDNFWVVVGEFPGFCRDESSVLERLLASPRDEDLPQWDVALTAWQYYRTTILGADPTSWNANRAPLNTDHAPSDADPTPSDDPTSSGADLNAGSLSTDPTSLLNPDPSPRPITFRVTATRGGRKHCFTSMEAAAHLGAGLSERYGWKVQMKEADLEVLLTISGDDMSVSLALNKESKFKRNLSHFGPTSLRSTIAHGLLRMAGIQPGDVVVDPLCGGGSISIEGGLVWNTTFHLAGDNHDLAPPRTRANLLALEEKGVAPLVDVFQWDAGRLPLKTSSVDVVVTDLPFGKKSGTLQANWILYPRVLMELGRVCRPSSARAVLLTHDNKAFSRALQRNELWKRNLTRWVNVGGLTAAIFLLTRTSILSK